MKWADFFEKMGSRKVLECIVGDSRVATIFLAIDNSICDDKPILWETTVFGGKHNEYQRQCGGTRKNALRMHQEVVAMVRASQQ